MAKYGVDNPLRFATGGGTNQGGATGSVSSATTPQVVVIPDEATGATVYVSGPAYVAVVNSTSAVTVTSSGTNPTISNFPQVNAGTYQMTFFAPARANGDRTIQIASISGGAVTYYIGFLV
jgi:hypothetical protein